MTLTYQAYCDMLDALGATTGSRALLDEVIARYQGPRPRVPEWTVRPDVPAKMQQAAAARMNL